jgi:hypothetical protein
MNGVGVTVGVAVGAGVYGAGVAVDRGVASGATTTGVGVDVGVAVARVMTCPPQLASSKMAGRRKGIRVRCGKSALDRQRCSMFSGYLRRLYMRLECGAK